MITDESFIRRVAAAVAPRFRVEREVARGGMGVVFEAWDTELMRRVAIKALREEKASAEVAARFVREGRAQAQLRHPHVVVVFDAGVRDGISLIFMEYIEGPTLQRALLSGPLPPARVRRIGAQLAAALEVAHAKGIVHRDIKPANIFLDQDRAILGDFGIAAMESETDTTLTGDGQRLGTLAYMSPEQHAGDEVDGRTDIYSLGLVLREAVSGRDPFEAMTGDPLAGVPGDLRPLLGGMLEERSRRVGSATEVRERLERADAPAVAPVRDRRRWWMVGAGLAAAGLVAYMYLRPAPVSATADLIILPVDDAGGSGLGARIAQMIEGDLEWFPLLRLKAGEGGGSAPGATYRLRGDVALQGSRLAGNFHVRDSAGKLRHNIAVAGDTSDLQAFACAVADSVMRKAFPSLYVEYNTMGCRVSDVEAAELYIRGSTAFRQGDWEEAERYFEQALVRDPGLMHARWELMVARRYQRKDFNADLQALAARRDSLHPFYRALVEAQLTPELHERFRKYEDVVRSSRGAPKALLLYTNELYHRGALVGRPIMPVVDSMAALAELHRDMQHSSTYDISIWGNIRLGREGAAWKDFNRRAQLVGSHPDRNGPFQRFAIWSRFEPWKAWVARTIMFRSPDAEVMAALTDFTRLGTMFDIPWTQVHLGRVLVEHADSLEHEVVGRLAQGLGHLMLGRTRLGLDWLDSAAGVLPSPEMELQRHEWPVMLAVLGIPVARAQVDDARAWLRVEGLRGDTSLRARAHWTLGMDALARGDILEAGHQRAALAALAPGDPAADRLASLLSASMLGDGGAYRAAIDSTRSIFLADSVSRRLSPFTRAATYLARGRWYRALGAKDQADREWLWYENSDYEGWPTGEPQQGEVDAVLGPLARLLRGELAIERLRPMDACRYLPRVRELWRDAEPAMDSLRARADSAAVRAHCP